jgi:hypothetical protein
MFSYICDLDNEQEAKKWLVEDLGVSIHKSTKIKPFDDIFVQIMFYATDPEFETMVALRYPKGTFQRHMA